MKETKQKTQEKKCSSENQQNKVLLNLMGKEIKIMNKGIDPDILIY